MDVDVEKDDDARGKAGAVASPGEPTQDAFLLAVCDFLKAQSQACKIAVLSKHIHAMPAFSGVSSDAFLCGPRPWPLFALTLFQPPCPGGCEAEKVSVGRGYLHRARSGGGRVIVETSGFGTCLCRRNTVRLFECPPSLRDDDARETSAVPRADAEYVVRSG